MTLELPLVSTSIKTQVQAEEIGNTNTLADVRGTFANDGKEHWVIAKTRFEGLVDLPWIGDDGTIRRYYFLPFEWNTAIAGVGDLTSEKTWGFGVDLTCKLLEGDVYGQQSWEGTSGGSVPKPAVVLNVTIPTADGGTVRCNNPLVAFTVNSLKTGNFSGEYLFGLGPTDRGGKEAEDFCNSLLVVV